MRVCLCDSASVRVGLVVPFLGSNVDGRGALIHKHELRRVEIQAGNGQALLLSAREDALPILELVVAVARDKVAKIDHGEESVQHLIVNILDGE